MIKGEIYIWSQYITMAQCKTAVTPLLTHWSYCSLALSHWFKDDDDDDNDDDDDYDDDDDDDDDDDGISVSCVSVIQHLASTLKYTIKISNISFTKSQNFNDSCLISQLSLPNPLKVCWRC